VKSISQEKSDALTVLRGVVAIKRHAYERCEYSGAGNCWCGRHERHTLHAERGRQVSVRITEEDYERLHAAATSHGQTSTGFAKLTLLRALDK
jgi:hypothetical protein